MAKSISTTLSFDQYVIPVKIYKEWRSSVRYSLGRKAAIVRLPLLYPKKHLHNEVFRLEQWLKTHIKKDHRVASRFIPKEYKTGDTLVVRQETFTLTINIKDRKTNVAKIIGHQVHITLSNELIKSEYYEHIRKLLSRSFSKRYISDIEALVFDYNRKYFQKDIVSVKLKNNQSNWGSCSSKNNINLSSRLLMAPQEVLEYVIIHELAHLVEMNHSKAFWDIVKNIMPDYKSKEQWLNKNGHSLKF